jgi:hypothetical protein
MSKQNFDWLIYWFGTFDWLFFGAEIDSKLLIGWVFGAYVGSELLIACYLYYFGSELLIGCYIGA